MNNISLIAILGIGVAAGSLLNQGQPQVIDKRTPEPTAPNRFHLFAATTEMLGSKGGEHKMDLVFRIDTWTGQTWTFRSDYVNDMGEYWAEVKTRQAAVNESLKQLEK